MHLTFIFFPNKKGASMVQSMLLNETKEASADPPQVAADRRHDSQLALGALPSVNTKLSQL